MNAYEMKTGLHGISSARRLVSHAISSIDEMNVQSRLFCLIFILTKLIFAERVKPAYSSAIDIHSENGRDGLSFQTVAK